MRIDVHEQISIWLVGNTGLRNPMRIQEGFVAFAQSPYVGNLHGRENELGFMGFLNKSGIINNQEGKDTSGSHARKWRLMFERYGLIYGQAKAQNGFTQEELGRMDDIRVFTLKNRIVFPVQMVIDEGIWEELSFPFRKQPLDIESNEELEDVVRQVLGTKKLRSIVNRLMDKNNNWTHT